MKGSPATVVHHSIAGGFFSKQYVSRSLLHRVCELLIICINVYAEFLRGAAHRCIAHCRQQSLIDIFAQILWQWVSASWIGRWQCYVLGWGWWLNVIMNKMMTLFLNMQMSSRSLVRTHAALLHRWRIHTFAFFGNDLTKQTDPKTNSIFGK